jgi:hypothetical protein
MTRFFVLAIALMTIIPFVHSAATATDTTWQALSTQMAQDDADLMAAIDTRASAEDLQALDAKFAENMQSSYASFDAKAAAVQSECKAESGQARFELVSVGAALILTSCVLEYYRRR